MLLGLVVVIGAIVWAVFHFLLAKPEQETDDAYVAGDVIYKPQPQMDADVRRLAAVPGVSQVVPMVAEEVGKPHRHVVLAAGQGERGPGADAAHPGIEPDDPVGHAVEVGQAAVRPARQQRQRRGRAGRRDRH